MQLTASCGVLLKNEMTMNTKLSSLGWLVLLLPFFCVGLAHAALSSSFGDETRDVRGFHGISNSGNIVVEVRLGNEETLRLEGDAAAIREIETIVEGGTLKIRYRKQSRSGVRNWGTVTAYVTAKQLDDLSQSGSGKITVTGTVSGKELNTSVSGSGRITVTADAAELNASISGSGRIIASGNATRCNASISGSGRFEGGSLESQTANLKISGSGNITIHADKQLDASISGSGNVNYSGNAQTNVRTSGSGRLRKI